MRGRFLLAAILAAALANGAAAQTYFYSTGSNGSGVALRPWSAGTGNQPAGYGVGPANYTWVSPQYGYGVAPNTGTPWLPQGGGRVQPRIVRFVPYASNSASAVRPVGAATPPAKPDADRLVAVPKEDASESALAAVAAKIPGVANAANAPMSLRPVPYMKPLRPPARNATRSAYASPLRTGDGKADWAPLGP